jgi:hypothetical protein
VYQLALTRQEFYDLVVMKFESSAVASEEPPTVGPEETLRETGLTGGRRADYR